MSAFDLLFLAMLHFMSTSWYNEFMNILFVVMGTLSSIKTVATIVMVAHVSRKTIV